MSCGSVTSQALPATSSPSLRSSFTVSSTALAVRAQMYTRCPCSASLLVTASPIPLVAPVTAAIRCGVRDMRVPPTCLASDELFVDGSEEFAGRLDVVERGVVQRDPDLALEPGTGLEQRQRVVAQLVEGQIEDLAVEVDVLGLACDLAQHGLEVVDGGLVNRHHGFPSVCRRTTSAELKPPELRARTRAASTAPCRGPARP